MQFARTSFTVAGWWGIVSLAPLFFMYRFIGQQHPPALTHPEYFFGFLCVTFAWQLAFLVIARDPSRYRLLILAAIFEKFSYAVACFLLASMRLTAASTATFAIVDLCLGGLL